MLRGRIAECARLDRLLDSVRSGQSATLVLRGEAGIGKSALLGYAAEQAQGCRVIRASGVESEMELPFAGLHQLCVPVLDRLDGLPHPQRDALGTAFGLRSSAPPERFLVGLAVLSLLSDAAEERPLVCIVDDAQWLDRASAQALAFVARRLQAESVVLVFAARELSGELAGLPELVVEGLPEEDARALLGSVIRGRLDERVRDRIVAEARGNPLALVELPRGLTRGELAGGFGSPSAQPLSGQIEDSFRRQFDALPPETQRLMLIAAAEPLGDPALLWRAAARLGISVDAVEPAEAAGLLTMGGRVTFRHPLLRSAVYGVSQTRQRHEVHAALAEATDPDVDPDRRAWHRAHATIGPDDVVAAELERSADRAKARGGLAAAAAFLERATELTVEPAPRAARALSAAQARLEAGAPDIARKLLAMAEIGPLDELQYAQLDRLRAKVALAQTRGNDASSLLLSAARRLEPLDAELAGETYLEALSAAILVGPRDALTELGRALPSAAPPRLPNATELLLEGYALLVTEGFPAGTDLLKRALNALRDEPLSRTADLWVLWFACRIATSLWDHETWYVLASRYVKIVRDAGALNALPDGIDLLADWHVFAGELSTATALLEEADAITEATGSAPRYYLPVVLHALHDEGKVAAERIEAVREEAIRKEDDTAIATTEFAAAVLDNGLGRYEAALRAAQRSADHHPQQGAGWLLVELVEAAARSGEREVGASALERLSGRTQVGGTDWALGVEASSRALLSDGKVAEELYQEAIERLSRTRVRTHLARAHLVYGEWLRRERRRLDAREHLRMAHGMFETMGAPSFAQRAARELQATGEKARERRHDASAQLTGQEAQVAQLARDGHSNPEIGAQLFISPRTVEYHLHKVFTKLDITSRAQLDSALPQQRQAVHRV
jgi:DNA-binding CsgD family transcriptional regulator